MAKKIREMEHRPERGWRLSSLSVALMLVAGAHGFGSSPGIGGLIPNLPGRGASGSSVRPKIGLAVPSSELLNRASCVWMPCSSAAAAAGGDGEASADELQVALELAISEERFVR